MIRPALLWLAAAGLTVAGVAFTGPAAARARSRARTHATRLAQVDGLVRQIADRRTQAPPWATTAATGASLPERLATAVTAAGLPPGVLLSVSPSPQEKIAGSVPALRQRASVSLGGLSLRDLGRLLERWRASDPAWVVTSIDLAPEAKTKAEPGADLPLRAALTLERLSTGAAP